MILMSATIFIVVTVPEEGVDVGWDDPVPVAKQEAFREVVSHLILTLTWA